MCSEVFVVLRVSIENVRHLADASELPARKCQSCVAVFREAIAIFVFSTPVV